MNVARYPRDARVVLTDAAMKSNSFSPRETWPELSRPPLPPFSIDIVVTKVCVASFARNAGILRFEIFFA